MIHQSDPAKPALAEPEWLSIEPWHRDPATIPPREFLYEEHYVRGVCGATIGGGGRGKTSLSCAEAVSMAVGRNLMTGRELENGLLRVWLLNAEEVQDEVDRRIAAVLQYYKITIDDLGGRLWAQSVRNQPMRIATLDKGAAVINVVVAKQMSEFIGRNKIDVFMVDPLISFHSVRENDNGDMDLVIKQGFGAVASKTNSAGELYYHPGKPKPGQLETTVDDGRGASAVLWGVRSARVLNCMTRGEATQIRVPEEERRRYIRISNGKANMGPVGKVTWMTENLPNGDTVACVTSWKPPKPVDGITKADAEVAQKLAQGGTHRADPQAREWFGYLLGERLCLDPCNNPADKAKLKTVIENWLELGSYGRNCGKTKRAKGRSSLFPVPP